MRYTREKGRGGRSAQRFSLLLAAFLVMLPGVARAASRGGMVVTEQSLATGVGVDILRQGR